MIIVFSAIIVIHELGHFLAAKMVGVKVERFSIGFGPALFKTKRGDTEFALSLVPLGGYVKLAGETPGDNPTGAKDELLSKNAWQRFIIFVSGAFFNILSAFVVISVLFMTGESAVPSGASVVGEIKEGYPAGKAGLKKGDAIIGIDGKKISGWEEMTSIIHKNEGTPIRLEVRRGDRVFDISVTPRTEEIKDIFGRDIKMSIIGIAPEIITRKYAPVSAIWMGAKSTVLWTGKTYQALWLIVTRQVPLKGVMGPVGILAMTSRAARTGIVALFGLIALISINLAVINLLPIPVLDGGHVLFLVIEKIRGRRLSVRVQEVITQIFFYLLIGLILLVSWRDVTRLFFKG